MLACNFLKCKRFYSFLDFISSPVCYEYKVYIGHDITYYEGIENPYECQMRCQGISQCTFWSWIETDLGAKQCWPKEYIINKNEHGSHGQSVISGPKSCGIIHSNRIILTKSWYIISNSTSRNMSSGSVDWRWNMWWRIQHSRLWLRWRSLLWITKCLWILYIVWMPSSW